MADPSSILDEARPSAAPALAAPVPPTRPLRMGELLRTIRDSTIATYPAAAYDADIIVGRRFLWRRTFIVNAPDAIKHILLDNAGNYRKTEITRRLLEPGLGRGLLTSEGETWRRHRRIMAPAFDHRSIAAYGPVMAETAAALLADWDRLPEAAELDIAAAMMRTTLLIISRTMFSSDSDEIVDVVERGVQAYQTRVRPTFADLFGLPSWLPGLGGHRGADRVFDEFDRAIDRLLESRGRAGAAGPKDLLARLMAARDEETGGGMTNEEVRDQVVTIFMAGHETTALALTWTWYLLSLHPDAEAKLHAELDAVLDGRRPRYEDLASLPYSRTVIEEAMRLYPPAHTLSRTAVREDRVLGQRIPAGTTIIIAPWLLHRNPKLWERPLCFEPERFAPERAATRHRFAYIPFGAGPRICIGAAFATAEAMLILASIAQRYRLRLKPGFPVDPQGLITLRARHGMRMMLERRR